MDTALPVTHPDLLAAGLVLHQAGPFGYALFDTTNGYPVTDRVGLPEAMFNAPDGDNPHGEIARMLVDWQWLTVDRPAMFSRIAAGELLLADAGARGGADWLRAIEACPDPGTQLTDEVVGTACARTETPLLGEVLYACYEAGADPEVISSRVGTIWTSTEYPDSCLDHEFWQEMFDVAGFRLDGEKASRPTAPVRLYRGSVAERRTDWSWTTSFEVAHNFAHGGKGLRPRTGTVWTALVEPGMLLARNDGRSEDEWVANIPEHLIVACDEPCGCVTTGPTIPDLGNSSAAHQMIHDAYNQPRTLKG